MGLKQKKKINRKTICGRGYCCCQNKYFVQGKGIMDIDSKVLESIPESIDNVMKINDSTKTIVKEILNKRKPNNLQNIVDKINRFKTGSGFVYV